MCQKYLLHYWLFWSGMHFPTALDWTGTFDQIRKLGDFKHFIPVYGIAKIQYTSILYALFVGAAL